MILLQIVGISMLCFNAIMMMAIYTVLVKIKTNINSTIGCGLIAIEGELQILNNK